MQTDRSHYTILDFYSRSHTACLHACGEKATALLIEKVSSNPGEKILEIGFGTGATMVWMARKFPGSRLYGVDISGQMLKTALKRLRFCGVRNRCQLSLLVPGERLPFPQAYFDTIYAESVLGILEGAHFEAMLDEIARVLKPGGQFVFNETIWLDTATPEDIRRINADCKTAFGIIQANEEFPYPADWSAILKEKGFLIAAMIRLDHTALPANREAGSVLSRIFTFAGKIKAVLFYRRFFKKFKKAGENINGERQYMAGFIVTTKKPDALTAAIIQHQ